MKEGNMKDDQEERLRWASEDSGGAVKVQPSDVKAALDDIDVLCTDITQKENRIVALEAALTKADELAGVLNKYEKWSLVVDALDAYQAAREATK